MVGVVALLPLPALLRLLLLLLLLRPTWAASVAAARELISSCQAGLLCARACFDCSPGSLWAPTGFFGRRPTRLHSASIQLWPPRATVAAAALALSARQATSGGSRRGGSRRGRRDEFGEFAKASWPPSSLVLSTTRLKFESQRSKNAPNNWFALGDKTNNRCRLSDNNHNHSSVLKAGTSFSLSLFLSFKLPTGN